MKLYLAGPNFTRAELNFNASLARELEAIGYEVWLPQEKLPEQVKPLPIFLKDVEGINWADVVVACMDGPDPDSGTCWECGYAYKKKPVVLYRTDFRKLDDMGAMVNLMLTESADDVLRAQTFKTVKELTYYLDRVLSKFVSKG